MITASDAHLLSTCKYGNVFYNIEKAARKNKFSYTYCTRSETSIPTELYNLLKGLGYNVTIKEDIVFDEDHYGKIVEGTEKSLYDVEISW